MNSGIYALFWWQDCSIYIGQSQDLHRRKSEHFKSLLKQTHSNYKVQHAYNTYGLPEFIVIEEANLSNLNTLEIYWQKEFNSLASLDLVYAGEVGYGVHCNSSKYSKVDILKTFRCIYLSKYTRDIDIAIYAGVDVSLVSDIRNSKTHIWLKDIYPNKYQLMRSVPRSYISVSKISSISRDDVLTLISPNGEQYKVVDSISNLARQIRDEYYPSESEEVIRKGISRVFSKIRKSWRKWVLNNSVGIV